MSQYLEIIKLGVDQYKKVPVTDFSQESRNEAIRGKFLEVMGVEKFDIMAYEAHKNECFAIMREILTQTIADGEAPFAAFNSAFVEERNIADGDDVEFEIKNDSYLTVGEISGNNWDLDRQRKDAGATIKVDTKAYYIKVYEYFKRFMTGRMDFVELIDEVDRSIKRFKNEFIAKVFQSAIDGLPDGFSYSGSYNKAEIQKVLTNTSAANLGSDVVLVGTKSALSKLQGLSDVIVSPTMADEINEYGYLRRWNGYNAVELPTAFKANSISEFVFDTDDIYILPTSEAKPVKLVNKGEILVMETPDQMSKKDMTKEFAVIFQLGGAAIFDRLIGKLEITG